MKTISLCLVLFMAACGYSQDSTDFKFLHVNKKFKDFSYDFDLSSPLKAFVTLNYINMEGKDNLLRSVYTIKTRSALPDSTAQNSKKSSEEKNMLLDSKILEVMIYKDSIAFVISEVLSRSHYLYPTRSFYLENGNWVSNGETITQSFEDARFRVFTRKDLYFADYESIQNQFYRNKK